MDELSKADIFDDYYCKRQDGQEIKGNNTIIFKNAPSNDFIDLYNVLKRNVEVLEEVERLLKQRSANR